MWSKNTLSSEMLAFEITAQQAQGVADPAGGCSGIVWWARQVEAQPGMSAEDLRQLYEGACRASEAPRGWARGLLENQGHLLYQEFRQTMIDALPDGALAHMVCDDYPFTGEERQEFKERIRGRFKAHPNYHRIKAIVDG